MKIGVEWDMGLWRDLSFFFKNNFRFIGVPGWLSPTSAQGMIMIHGFKPHIRLCADCLLRAWKLLQILSRSLSALPLPTLCLTLSLKNK